MEDNLILVDFDDVQIGTEKKLETHRRKLLHRAFSVFLFNGDMMLIQKRQTGKYHSAGLWANACCSHPRNGERLDYAVKRRIKEELGIECKVRELFSFTYFSAYENGIYEYEYDHVFTGEYSDEIYVDENEISEIKWIKIDELKEQMLFEPEKFSSWFMIAAPKVLKTLEETECVKNQNF